MTLFINFQVNVVCHRWGLKDNPVNNTSTNNFWTGFTLLGTNLHNNHHARPNEWHNGWGNYKFDFIGDVVGLIQTKQVL